MVLCLSSWELLILVATLSSCLYLWLRHRLRHFARRGIPCVQAYPLVGSLGPVVFRRTSCTENVARVYDQLGSHRFGGMFVFMKPVIVIKDPDIIKRVTVKDFHHFVDRDPPMSEECDDMFGRSVFALRETLRLYPPVRDLERRCVRPYWLPAPSPSGGSAEGVWLREGDVVSVPVYGLHCDPLYWPDPLRFDPRVAPCTFLPFGSGPRACIGTRFAMMVVKVAVVHLLANFELRVVERTPIDLKLSTNSFSINVDGGFWVGLEPRQRSHDASDHSTS